MDINLTVVGQAGTFLVLVWAVMKYVWPQVTTAMETRRQTIAEGLAAAEESKRELANAQEESAKLVKDAQAKANEIVEQARKQASRLVEEAKAEAQAERQRQLAAAEQEVALEAQRAREALRADVAKLAVAGATQVIGREIDREAHNDLLDKLVAEL